MRCCLGQRSISSECLPDAFQISDRMRSLPEDSRRCSECNELVRVYPFPNNNPGLGRTFDKADVVGCERMIGKVIEGFIEEFGFADCFEQKKSQNVSGASH